MAFLEFRIVFNSLTKKLLSRNQIAVLGVNHRQISACFCQFRLQVQCRFKPLLRGFEVASGQLQAAQFGANQRQLRVDIDRLAECVFRALRIIHRFQGQREIVSRLGAVRVLFEHVAINLRRI